jgi:hypothetical protein
MVVIQAQDGVYKEGTGGDASLENAKRTQRSRPVNGAFAEHRAPHGHPEKEGRKRSGSSRRRGAEEQCEATHPENFIDERQGSGREREKMERGFPQVHEVDSNRTSQRHKEHRKFSVLFVFVI